MSKGAEQLREIIQEIYGQEVKIKDEYCIGRRLRLDFYLPACKIGFEFHGVQHEKYSEHFHGSALNFRASKRRDRLKQELALEQKISLVTIWHSDPLTVEFVKTKIKEAIS
tara:strand:+ start:1667 stop:1999 length:333 start_codon:yes stop_codon:yes gene_type:complete